ncbi:MAG: hypothetical protein ACKV2U_29620, partial [Bryobacteraceae bacterium]
ERTLDAEDRFERIGTGETSAINPGAKQDEFRRDWRNRSRPVTIDIHGPLLVTGILVIPL